MGNMLLSPLAAFAIMLAAMLLFMKLLSLLSYKTSVHEAGTRKSYACGEDAPTNLMQPDYSQFFPFAFFFTILHVFTLIVATAPVLTPQSFVMASIYILAAITGLVILFRR